MMSEVLSSQDTADAERAERFWAPRDAAEVRLGYWSQPYLNEVFTSHTDGKWYLNYVRDKYFEGKPAKRALSLGCGAGQVDRAGLRDGVFEQVLGLDFSHASLEAARRDAAAEGLTGATYRRADFNVDGVPGDVRYDLIYDHACSHHIERLEVLYREVERVLEDDGYFVIYGYCGPARMQWSDRVLELGNELLRRMPMRLREAMPEISRVGIWEYMAGDPSEGVRGSEIVDLARAFFDVVEEVQIGSTLTQPMFSANSFALNPDSPSEQAIFRMVCEYEQVLIANEVLPADVRLLVCRRRRNDLRRPPRPS